MRGRNIGVYSGFYSRASKQLMQGLIAFEYGLWVYAVTTLGLLGSIIWLVALGLCPGKSTCFRT